MRYAAVISYLGTRYVGWQRQINGLSVQEVLEKALTTAFQAPTQATASGRTDAGVHAQGQVVHFDADTTIPVDKIPFAINTLLPDDISMLTCEVVDDNFNARFSAKRKTYCYKLYVSRHRLPIYEPTHEHVILPLDYNKMRACADVIEGEHDFKCFEASGSVIKNTVRTVYSVDIKCIPLTKPTFHKDANNYEDFSNLNAQNAYNCLQNDGTINDCEVLISVTGNGFLYNMVRIIAGTLVYCGLNKLTANEVEDIILSGDRKRAGKTLSAKGLHLIKVVY